MDVHQVDLDGARGLISDYDAQLPRFTVDTSAVDEDLMEILMDEAREQAAAIQLATAAGDSESLKRAAHVLKGLGGTMAAPGVSVVGAELEQQAEIANARRDALIALIISWANGLS